MRVVFEDDVLIVEIGEGKCIVTNKLDGRRAQLVGTYDGFFQLNMLVERWGEGGAVKNELAP